MRLMNTQATIAAQLKRLRKERQLTQEELSQLANIDNRHYQRLESGEILASITTLFKLSIALQIEFNDLTESSWTNYKDSHRLETHF